MDFVVGAQVVQKSYLNRFLFKNKILDLVPETEQLLAKCLLLIGIVSSF